MQYTLRRAPLVAALSAFALLLLPHQTHAASVTVVTSDNQFTPQSLTVNPGDTVTWVNQGASTHTVTADNGSFNSGSIAPGQQFSATFNQSGTYAYHDASYGSAGGVGMAGTVTVTGNTNVTTSYTNPNATYYTNAPTTVSSYPTQSVTNASAVAQLTAQVQSLLAQISALQAQQGLSSGGGNVVNSASCPLIGRTLSPGSSGSDVLALQQFLISQGLLNSSSATGYYGSLTQGAVQQWQAAHNIVSSGSPSTTGYGVVGPRTAAAISLLCSTTGGGGTSPSVGGFIQVTPVSGTAPLTVSVRATVNTTTACGGASYTIDFGDGTAPQTLTVPSGTCGQQIQTYQHTYIYGGTYQVALTAGSHTTSATVTVSGPAAPTTPSGGTTNPTQPVGTFTTFTRSGNAPLTVTFYVSCASGVAYNVVFGDGTDLGGSGVSSAKCASGSLTSVSHTYTTQGTYQAQLIIFVQQSNGTIFPNTIASIDITVGSVANSYSYNPPQLSPGSSNLAFSLQFDLPTSCTGYDVSWGDGSAHDTQGDGGTTCAQTSVTTTRTHTYAASGTYTITLRRGPSLSRTDTIAVTVAQ